MKNLFRVVLVIAGAALGPGLIILFFDLIKPYFDVDPHTLLPAWATLMLFISAAVIFGVIFFFLSKPLYKKARKLSSWIEGKALEYPAKVTFTGIAGLVIGLVVAFLLSQIITDIGIEWIRMAINILIYLICGYIFMRIAVICAKKMFAKKKVNEDSARRNILDTSAVIDGRIFDICKTGIVEGSIVVPVFVLDELRHIADSEDALKRSKGRRGLDILDRLKKEQDINVEVSSKNYDDIAEVDAKLLAMAEEEHARIITNDFNLNKVAAVRNVKVFNINDLANAIKPVMVAGESMEVAVIKEGKDPTQGIGYLEDGTMIVVENGRQLIGKTISAEVTSILQTSAGRLIFVKPT